MSRRLRLFIVFLTLTVVILACALPVSPAGQPTLEAPDPNQVSTAIAMTLTALAPAEGSATAPAEAAATAPVDASAVATVSAPADTAVSLPHTLYYLAPDSGGVTQVFRMERDGATRHQVTSETENVSDYDVSPVDGSVAYVVNNHLVHIYSDGSNRDVLIDGGPVDSNNPFVNTMSSPVFSPDGQTLAYGYKGLRVFSLTGNTSYWLLQNQTTDAGNGLLVPKELYTPERYSPDGSKLLITLGYYEGASSAIYDPATKALVRLDGGEGAIICCDDVRWASNGSSLYAASPTVGMFNSGLWKVDAATGKVTTLIDDKAGDNNYNLADEAYLAPDGQLYFFFATASSPDGMIMRSPLQLVRSAPDGVTGRTVLSKEDFQLLNEALWAPDASFVIAALAPTQEVYQGGQAEIVYLDGRPNVVLAPFVQQMKWGP